MVAEWKLIAPFGQQVELTVLVGETESCCDKLEVWCRLFEVAFLQFGNIGY